MAIMMAMPMIFMMPLMMPSMYPDRRKNLVVYVGSALLFGGGWVVQFPWVFPPIALATVLVELGAPFALLTGPVGRRVRAVWAIAAWGFHVGVVVLMAISFPYPLSFIAYASLFAPERLLARVGRLLGRPDWLGDDEPTDAHRPAGRRVRRRQHPVG